MCGRFALSIKTKNIENLVPGLKVGGELKPRYNIAPSQDAPTIFNTGDYELSTSRWGLIPFWSKDIKIGVKLINARAETVAEKPAFKNAFNKRRCLIVADGYYEWKNIPGANKKAPYYIRLKTGEAFTFAGLWEKWKSLEGKTIVSSTIITTEPNSYLSDIHNRMPAILLPSDRELWLNPDNVEKNVLQNCLMPYPDEEMEAFEVSLRVNSPKNDDESCILPINKLF